MLRSLMAAFPADEWPEVNQVELHPYLAQPELVQQGDAGGRTPLHYAAVR